MKQLTTIIIAALIVVGCATREPSPIRNVQYDAETKTLTVKFPNGTRYEYAGVPEQVYQGLEATKEKGKYFNEEIKGEYKTTKLVP